MKEITDGFALLLGSPSYADDTRDSQTEKLEWKIKRDRIQHAPYSLDLAPFDFAFFPQLKSDLHGKLFSDLDDLRKESDLKKDMVWCYLWKMGSTTQEMHTPPGRVF